MFKRVEKRRRKKEEEEKLGLDDDMKGILGLHDTDSDESDSDQDSDNSSRARNGEDGSEEEGDGEKGETEELQDSEDEDEKEGDEAPITVREALRDPVYVVSIQPDIKACIVCPGKLLKNSQMTMAHKTSHAHTRRFKQFTKLVCKVNLEDNAWEFVSKEKRSQHPVPHSPEESSKRAEKRRVKIAAIKTKRDIRKAAKIRARTRKEGMTAETMQESLKTAKPTKKRKMDAEEGIEGPFPPKRSKLQSLVLTQHVKKDVRVLSRKGSKHVKPSSAQTKQVKR